MSSHFLLFLLEIESFHKEQCLQSNVKLTKNEDGTESYPNTCRSYRDKVNSFSLPVYCDTSHQFLLRQLLPKTKRIKRKRELISHV